MLTDVRNLKNYFKDLFSGPHYYYHLNLEEMMTDDSTDFNVNYLLGLVRDELHVFDLSDEAYRERLAERLVELLTRFKFKKFLVLSHSLKYINNASHVNIIYFPHNYFDPAFYWNQDTGLKNIDVLDRKYFVSCLNGVARTQRIYNYIKLKQKPYINDILLSMHNNLATQEKSLDSVNDVLDPDDQSEWNSIVNHLPKFAVNDLDIEHEAYHDAYINLVTETFIQPYELFFTEKIYKPLACGQLFMVIGTTGCVKHLKDMGFDTFDDIIDHSAYDHIVDWKSKTNVIHDMLDQLKTLNWPQIYAGTKTRRLNNIRHFFSGVPVFSFGQSIAERMSYITKKNYIYDKNIILARNNYQSPAYKNLVPIHHLFRN